MCLLRYADAAVWAAGGGNLLLADLLRHGDVYKRQLEDPEYAVMVTSKDETIAWALWHIARLEDLTMNLLGSGGEQVLSLIHIFLVLNEGHVTGILNRDEADPSIVMKYAVKKEIGGEEHGLSLIHIFCCWPPHLSMYTTRRGCRCFTVRRIRSWLPWPTSIPIWG